MLKNIGILFCMVLLFVSCVKNDTDLTDTTTETPYIIESEKPTLESVETAIPTETPLQETPIVETVDTPDLNHWETPPPETPGFWDGNPAKPVGYYTVNYVYLTDFTETTPPTLVREGDTFLGWYAESIEAMFECFDDGSITYINVVVKFSGSTEIKTRLEYWDGSYGFDGVYAFVDEESYPLLPRAVIHCEEMSDMMFELRGDKVNELISESFNGVGGSIDDCKISIENFSLVFTYTSFVSSAEFVELIKD